MPDTSNLGGNFAARYAMARSTMVTAAAAAVFAQAARLWNTTIETDQGELRSAGEDAQVTAQRYLRRAELAYVLRFHATQHAHQQHSFAEFVVLIFLCGIR